METVQRILDASPRSDVGIAFVMGLVFGTAFVTWLVITLSPGRRW